MDMFGIQKEGRSKVMLNAIYGMFTFVYYGHLPFHLETMETLWVIHPFYHIVENEGRREASNKLQHLK